MDSRDAGFPEVTAIGQLGERPVFFARQPGLPGFAAWLQSLPTALVLVPTARSLPAGLTLRFSPGNAVELRPLDTELHLDGYAFVAAAAGPLLTFKDSMRASYEVAGAVCEVVDQDGRRSLSAAGYVALVADTSQFDLFLDTTVAVEGGGHRGSRRLPDGTVEEVVLTKHEAAAIIELVTTGRALRAGDFKTVTVNAVDKVVERARRKLDVRLGRYEWRAIHTLAGATPEAKRWQFRGAGVGRWAVVCATCVIVSAEELGVLLDEFSREVGEQSDCWGSSRTVALEVGE